ncbi:hypothetical protein, partial [Salmonella enterica]|uniref:hypothetical protein n=1 Tax=Salmonella enterica TaxID=28901 RepID=UPI0032B5B964
MTLSTTAFELGHYEETLSLIEQYEIEHKTLLTDPSIAFIKALSYKKLNQYEHASTILDAIAAFPLD